MEARDGGHATFTGAGAGAGAGSGIGLRAAQANHTSS